MKHPPDFAGYLVTAPPYRLFVVFWGGLAVVDVARAADAPDSTQIGLLAVLVAACCLGQGRGTTLAVAGVGWLVVTGFVVNDYGELTFTDPADAARLVLLGLVGLVASEFSS